MTDIRALRDTVGKTLTFRYCRNPQSKVEGQSTDLHRRTRRDIRYKLLLLPNYKFQSHKPLVMLWWMHICFQRGMEYTLYYFLEHNTRDCIPRGRH